MLNLPYVIEKIQCYSVIHGVDKNAGIIEYGVVFMMERKEGMGQQMHGLSLDLSGVIRICYFEIDLTSAILF